MNQAAIDLEGNDDAVQQTQESSEKAPVKKAVVKRATRKKAAKKAAEVDRIDRLEQAMAGMFDALTALTDRLDNQKTPEQIEAEYEARLDREAEARHAQQQRNRTDPELLRKLKEPRDPSIIRQMDNPNNEEFIRVVTKRNVGLNDTELSETGEEIDVPKSVAKKLQHAGAVEVKL